MSKILITADWHVDQGIYTDIAIDYISYLRAYCKKENINTIIIAGDIFEKASRIKNDAFVPLFFEFMKMKQEGYILYFLLGNHDIYNIDNDSIVETFSAFGKVIKEIQEIEIEGVSFTFLAYMKNISMMPTSGEILITHLPIADFSFDNKYHANEKNAFKQELFENYEIVFSGHFHRQQQKNNIVYIGSPYQLNFGEMNQEKGFIVFDTSTKEWNRISYTNAPTYIKIEVKDFEKTDVDNKFVGIKIDKKIDNFIQLKHLLYEKGAIEITPFFEQEDDAIHLKTEDFDFNSSISSLVKEYINNLNMKDIDNGKVMKNFTKILENI